jgi:hypothetical protein
MSKQMRRALGETSSGRASLIATKTGDSEISAWRSKEGMMLRIPFVMRDRNSFGGIPLNRFGFVRDGLRLFL